MENITIDHVKNKTDEELFELFLADISEEEKKLIKSEIFERNYELLLFLIRKYYRRCYYIKDESDFEEFRSYAITFAYTRFNFDYKKAKLSTHFYYLVINAIKEYNAEMASNGIHISRNIIFDKIRDCTKDDAELSKKNKEEVDKFKLLTNPYSLNSIIYGSSGDGDALEMINNLEDVEGNDFIDRIERDDLIKIYNKELKKLMLNLLTLQQYYYIIEYYFNGDNLQEIANRHNVSRQHVHHAMGYALKKLRLAYYKKGVTKNPMS